MSDPAENVVNFQRRQPHEFPGTLTPTGAIFDANLSFEAWAKAGQLLVGMYDTSCWGVGDWQIVGEARFGEAYAQALDQYAPDTLMDYRRVCVAFPMPKRRPESTHLRFGHFRSVYNRPEREREELLDLCEKYQWNRNQLRTELQRRKELREPELPGSKVTVVDVAREIGIDPAKELMWSAGHIVRDLWEQENEKPPEKDLRQKTNASGSHDFAIYPRSWFPRIEAVIRELVAKRERIIEIKPGEVIASDEGTYVGAAEDDAEAQDFTFAAPQELDKSEPEITVYQGGTAPEPAPASPADAAAFLRSVASAMPANIGGAILVLVGEYERLAKLEAVVKESVALGYITPTLTNATI